ncbi:MAG TPA: uracil-DNA glycosylase [Patescibacteria group bacterium]|nr:uracil-DNA glycosylase [Patescibacteria group bacterium]
MGKQELLNQLKKKMSDDVTLPLRKGSTQLVFGDGNPDAKILFIGEGPGYWEDVKGIPFVGNAGALLNQMLMMVKVPRKDVFITNVIHHRAPQNRDPLPEEIKAYQPYLDEIIKVIDPKVIVTLGRFSMAKFLPGVFISSVHGREKKVQIDGKNRIILPMYHPAAALRNGDVKLKFKMDFEKLPDILKEADKIEEQGVVKEKDEAKAEQMNLI